MIFKIKENYFTDSQNQENLNPDNESNSPINENLLTLILTSCLAGIISSMLGVGGGLIVVPLLLKFKFNPQVNYCNFRFQVVLLIFC